MFKRVILIIISISLLAGAAIAADPQQPFLPFYWVKGRVTSAETGDAVPDREVAFYRGDFATSPRVTATSDAAGYYKINVYELNYYYGVPITYETESYKAAVPRTTFNNRGTEESLTLTTEAGYTVRNLVLIEGGGPMDRSLGAGPILNLTVLLEGLNRGAPDNNIPGSLEVELRTGGATADTALPANMAATCEVSLAANGSGSNYGWWYGDVYPTAGRKYYLVIKQKIPGAPVGANHIPVITASSWEIVSQPGALTLDLTTSESVSFAEAFTPSGGYAPALKSSSLGGRNRLLMRAGYLAIGRKITQIDYNRWSNAYYGSSPPLVERIITNIKGEGELTQQDYNFWSNTYYIDLLINRDKDRDIYVP